MIFLLPLNGAILLGLAICWTVSERAGGLSWGNRQLHYAYAVSILFQNFCQETECCTLLSGRYLFSLSCNGAMYWEFMFINFTLPVLNNNYKIIHHLSLCYIANLLATKMVCLTHSLLSPILPVTFYNLLFQITNHWSALCPVPLQNSMPCLSSLKVCIYYTQLIPNLTVFVIVFDLVLQQLLPFKMKSPSFCSFCALQPGSEKRIKVDSSLLHNLFFKSIYFY